MSTRSKAFILALSILIPTACDAGTAGGSHDAVPTPAHEPNSDTFAANAAVLSHRWFAPVDVDLDAPAIQAVRAYHESNNLYWSTGEIDSGYPGYGDLYQGPVAHHINPYRRTGTIDEHVLDVRIVDDGQGHAVTHVSFCEDRSGTAEPTGGTWTVRETNGGLIVLLVSATENSTTPIVVDVTRRIPYPTWDAFDGWTITDTLGNLDFTPTVGSADSDALLRQCLYAQPRLNPDVESGDVLTAAPVVETPVPGWPTEIGASG
ncbi:MAG: hypothetical protein WAX14_14445 [Rhodococcus sp. (in: high G+C Gram-positive bacteria)]|uniref:hypothetical protein n=1 Tax=Rhodococcus sp. TaxID=1831 RepID=UPI003BB4DC16